MGATWATCRLKQGLQWAGRGRINFVSRSTQIMSRCSKASRLTTLTIWVPTSKLITQMRTSSLLDTRAPESETCQCTRSATSASKSATDMFKTTSLLWEKMQSAYFSKRRPLKDSPLRSGSNWSESKRLSRSTNHQSTRLSNSRP